MKKWILLIGLSLTSTLLFAQKEDEEAVKKAVLTLFDGMRASDADIIKKVFVEAPDMYTVAKNKEGKTILRKGDFENFLKSVGTPHEKMYDEPIWNTEVKIDGDLAYVWTDYAFYLGKDFSHCGVDAFSLVKQDNQWKIFHLTDTRRKDDCKVPNKIKKARE